MLSQKIAIRWFIIHGSVYLQSWHMLGTLEHIVFSRLLSCPVNPDGYEIYCSWSLVLVSSKILIIHVQLELGLGTWVSLKPEPQSRDHIRFISALLCYPMGSPWFHPLWAQNIIVTCISVLKCTILISLTRDAWKCVLDLILLALVFNVMNL